MEGLHGLVVGSDVEVLADDGDIDGVSKVGLKEGWDVAVGEHFFDLIDCWVGGSHDEELMLERGL